MKHLLLATTAIALCTTAARAQWSDDFDTYAANSQTVGQGGWEEWGPLSGALISTTQARTPSNSVNISGPSDLVHQYSGYTSGTWVYTARQYIPTGSTGSTYFIMMNKYAYPAGPYSWSMQLLFNTATGQASQNCGGPAVISMPFVYNQWAEIKVVVSLDQDWCQIYYNGVLFDDPAVANHVTLGGGYRWSLGDGGTNTTGIVNIAAVDLYANGASAVYYDDISLRRPTAWHDDFDAYAANSQAVGQGTWEEWNAGAGALVSNAQSYSAPNSVAILGATDLVHQYSGYTSGTWVYKTRQFIPTGTTGTTYFILLNNYAFPAGPYSWSVETQFNAGTGTASQRCGGTASISLPLVTGQWVEIKAIISLTQDWVQLYYNGVLFDDPAVANHPTLGGGYRWSFGHLGTNVGGLVNIGAVDLYANNASVVYYDDMSLTPFQVETIGLGCAGSMAASRVTSSNPARLGQNLQVAFDNMPQSAGFVIIGLSTVNSINGPLPFDLGVAGMPNCKQRVSDDAHQLMIGAANKASYSLTVPTGVGFLGLRLNVQALILDPAAGNALGAVVSDAATAIVQR